MSLNAIELKHVAELLNQDLVAGQVREIISEREPGQLTIGIRSHHSNQFLRIVLTHPLMRIGRIACKPKGASSPHPFVMLLRKELTGKRISDITQLNNDRIIVINTIRNDNQISLIIELTSRHPNLFLLDQSGVILGSFFPNRSSKRELSAGSSYIQPLPPEGMTPPSRFTLDDTLEIQIDEHYSRLSSISRQTQKRQTLNRMLKAALKKTTKLIQKLETDLERAENGNTLFSHGHIVKTHLREIQKGATSLDATDFDGNPVTISLNPKLSPVANMQRLFNKAKRMTRAIGQIENRLLSAMAEADRLEELSLRISETTLHEMEEIEESLTKGFPYLKRITHSKQTQETRLPYREYLIYGDRPARVGRSAKDNDTLTLRHAGPNDLWLHVRQETGSHVVVPMGRNETPTPELLVDAAHLAAHFSSLKQSPDVEVLYTTRRYVQKPKGSAPGSVRLLKDKTIFLKIEPERLKRLLSSRP